MKYLGIVLLLAGISGAAASAAGPPGLPPASSGQSTRPAAAIAAGETLKYKLLWPSGESLGEARFVATPAQGALRFEFTLEADLPMRDISADYTSVATSENLCSIRAERKTIEGANVSDESVEFDQKNHRARAISRGRILSFSIPKCARDPLTFLYYFRSQAAAGRPADAATFFVAPGSGLEISRTGLETVSVGGRAHNAEKYTVTFHGLRRSTTFEMWLATDAAHEPLLVRLPTSLATFSAELE